jgi:GDPmannose 4,6-dehydratase
MDILPIEDLFRAEKHRYEGILDEYKGALVWNGEYLTKIINGSCYRDAKKSLRLIQTREACCEATYEHICFDEENREVKIKDIEIGDKVFRISFPESKGELRLDKRLSKFIGYLVGDGSIDGRGRIRLTGIDKQELVKIANLVAEQFGWTYRLNTYGPGKYDNCKEDIWQLDINNDSHFGLWLRSHIYTKYSQEKRVPIFVLNSDAETKKAFFDGYYLADGRNKGNERYRYKGFTTKSATLCLGLIFIFRSFSQQTVKCKCEYRDGRRYYYVQFGVQNPTNKGKHLRKDLNEVIKVFDTVSPDGWFFDIQTESQTFATGPNLCKIHNSPRRGETFVTRKITRAIANIIAGNQKKLYLGNLEAKRDWGFAPEYVECMYLMLQQDEPDDYVIGTGESHSVREFVAKAFNYVGIEIEWKGKRVEEKGVVRSLKLKYKNLLKEGDIVVEIDPRYFRPTEVQELRADSSKAKEKLNWEPRVNFEELVKIMVDYDMLRVGLVPPKEGIKVLKEKGINWIRYEQSLIKEAI